MVRKILVAVLLLGVAFAAGYLYGTIPASRQAADAQATLEAAKVETARAADEIRATASKLKLADLGAKLGRIYAEVQQQNFGVANEKATPFFNGLQELLNSSPELEASERAALREVLARRDEVISELAKASPEIKNKMAQLYLKYLSILGN